MRRLGIVMIIEAQVSISKRLLVTGNLNTIYDYWFDYIILAHYISTTWFIQYIDHQLRRTLTIATTCAIASSSLLQQATAHAFASSSLEFQYTRIAPSLPLHHGNDDDVWLLCWGKPKYTRSSRSEWRL